MYMLSLGVYGKLKKHVSMYIICTYVCRRAMHVCYVCMYVCIYIYIYTHTHTLVLRYLHFPCDLRYCQSQNN